MSLQDRDAAPWVVDTLVDIRERRDPGRRDDDALGAAAYNDADGEAVDDADDEPADSADDEALDGAGDDASDEAVDEPPDDTPASEAPAGAPGLLPAADLIERDYDAFIERFKRETGQR
jgi:hypothetical protein